MKYSFFTYGTIARILVILVILAGADASADVLLLKDGDRLTGILVNIGGGTLSIRTRLAGKVMVPIDAVRGITTTSFIIVALGEEKLLPGRLVHENGQTFVVSQNGQHKRAIDLSQVTGIATLSPVVEAQVEPEPPPSPVPVNVTLETGYRWRTGTSESSGPFARIEVGGQTRRSEYLVGVGGEYTIDEDSFDRFFEAEARVRLGLGQGWRTEIAFEAERNRNEAIEFRGDLTVGAVRSLIDDERQELEVGLGAGIAFERFDPRFLERPWMRHHRRYYREDPKSDEDLNLDLRVRYTRFLFPNGNGAIEEGLVLRPSLTDFGDLRARLESALLLPITPRLRLRLDVLVDYDNDTVYDGIDEWRTSVGASLRLHF